MGHQGLGGDALGDATQLSTSGPAAFRVFVAQESECARFVQRYWTEGRGLFLPTATPAPIGVKLLLEMLLRETRERACAVVVEVVEAVGGSGEAGDKSAGMFVRLDRIEPGCSEELRRSFSKCQLVKPGDRAGATRTTRGVAVGIDLGTTFTCAAMVENGEPKVIRSQLGYGTIPSIVTFDDRGLPVVGLTAERRLVLQPDRVVYGSKRFIGRPYSKALVKQFAEHMRYEIVGDTEGMAAIKLGGRILSPIEVGACILAEIKRVAEATLRRAVTHAVITVPAAFTDNQRTAVKEAAARAGLQVLRIVNEPTAATLAFGYGRSENSTVLVYDLGGGTFDVSILKLSGRTYSVLATAGDTFLGGLDFDRLITGWITAQIRDKHGNVKFGHGTEERLLVAAREAKHSLSEVSRVLVQIPQLQVSGARTPTIEFSETMTRDQLDLLAGPLIDRTIATCDEALTLASLRHSDIGDVLLVGGQTRMPLISKRIQAHFKRPPSKRVHPDEVVALGAAILATAFEKADAPVLQDVLPLSIGIARPDGMMRRVLARNVRIPTSETIVVDAPAGRPLHVAVLQGDRPAIEDNELLGSFKCQLPDGDLTPQKVELTFALNSECILTIQSRVRSTGVTCEHHLVTAQTPDEKLSAIRAERVAPDSAVSPGPPSSAKSAPNRDRADNPPGEKVGWLKKMFGGKG